MTSDRIYLLATKDFHLLGYTFDKTVAKICKKQRKCIIDKMYIDEVPDNYIENTYDNEIAIMYNYAMTEAESEYFAEAWQQYIVDSAIQVEECLSIIHSLRLTDKDMDKLKPLIHVLSGYHHDIVHGIIDECEDQTTYFNYEHVMKFFVENIL